MMGWGFYSYLYLVLLFVAFAFLIQYYENSFLVFLRNNKHILYKYVY